MTARTYKDAKTAREQLVARMGWAQRRKTNGTALERVADGGWGIVVLVDRRSRSRKPLSVPSEMAGVPIRVAEVGTPRALTSSIRQ